MKKGPDVPKSIRAGYPEKEFIFVGYEEIVTGYYKALRNKKTVSMPVYESEDGERFIYMKKQEKASQSLGEIH